MRSEGDPLLAALNRNRRELEAEQARLIGEADELMKIFGSIARRSEE